MTTAKFQLTTLYYTKHCTSVKDTNLQLEQTWKKEEENETDFLCEVASEGEKENVAPSCLHSCRASSDIQYIYLFHVFFWPYMPLLQ
jgi:hypothetical protein